MANHFTQTEQITVFLGSSKSTPTRINKGLREAGRAVTLYILYFAYNFCQ